MNRETEDRKKDLANASVNTSTRGGPHDGQTGTEPPANMGLPRNDHQKGLDATKGARRSARDSREASGSGPDRDGET